MFGLFNKAQDPVCKMKVDKNETKYSSEYKGVKYYFCSQDCMKNFDKEPERYIVQQENIPAKSCCQQSNKSCC